MSDEPVSDPRAIPNPGWSASSAAVVSGEADLTASTKDRPEMMGVYRELIPGYAQHGPELLRDRDQRIVEWFKRYRK